MTLVEVLSNARTLSRPDQIRLIELLSQDLGNEGEPLLVEGQSYPVWSPDRAFAAADALLDALREDRGAT